MLSSFTSVSPNKFTVRFLAIIFFDVSVMRCVLYCFMESLPEMLLLILEFQEAQFLVSFPPYFFLKIFLMMLPLIFVILLHMMMLPSTCAPYCYLAMFDKLQELECGEASSTPPTSLRR